jgi:hypothetical protein
MSTATPVNRRGSSKKQDRAKEENANDDSGRHIFTGEQNAHITDTWHKLFDEKNSHADVELDSKGQRVLKKGAQWPVSEAAVDKLTAEILRKEKGFESISDSTVKRKRTTNKRSGAKQGGRKSHFPPASVDNVLNQLKRRLHDKKATTESLLQKLVRYLFCSADTLAICAV